MENTTLIGLNKKDNLLSHITEQSREIPAPLDAEPNAPPSLSLCLLLPLCLSVCLSLSLSLLPPSHAHSQRACTCCWGHLRQAQRSCSEVAAALQGYFPPHTHPVREGDHGGQKALRKSLAEEASFIRSPSKCLLLSYCLWLALLSSILNQSPEPGVQNPCVLALVDSSNWGRGNPTLTSRLSTGKEWLPQ